MQAKELNKKSVKELQKLIEDLKAELFTLRFKNSTGQLENPHKISLVKKDIARAFGAINAKEDEAVEVKKEEKEVKGGK